MTAGRPGDVELEVVRVRMAPPRVAPRPAPPAAPWLFAAAMASSVAIAVLGGLVLGFLAATETGFGQSHWTQAVQAHGRLQLGGWTAVFVAALSFEFVVRLNQRGPLPVLPRALVLTGLGAGAVVEAAAQVWNGPLGWLWVPGAALTVASSAGFAAMILRVRAAHPFRLDLQPLFFRLASAWLVAAAVVSLASAVRADGALIAPRESRLAVEVLVRGFVLNAIVAVALRAFPGHLGLRPLVVRRQGVVMGVLNVSTVAWVAGSGAFFLPGSQLLRALADGGLAAGLLAFTAWMGVLKPLGAPRGGPNYRVLVPLAWLGAVAYALALVGAAVAELAGDLTAYQVGAVRHIFLLGFMAPLMAAMAHIVLARFGTGRVKWEPLLTTAFVGLVVAWPLRVLPVLFVDSPGALGRGVMGVAAAVAMVSLAGFAVVAGANALAIRALVSGSTQRRG